MLNSVNCIIVDDELDAIELLKERISRLYKNVHVTGAYANWVDALEAIRQDNYDLLFMDISMPGKSGIELLRLIPALHCEIIFVTAYEQFALDAFTFPTSGYILKPISDTALSAAINKAIERIQNKRIANHSNNAAPAPAPANGKIGIPNNHGIDYLNINDILYLESTNKCTKIVTGKAAYISSLNLGKFQHLIDSHAFFQVHRSYIINLNSVLRYESSGIVVMSDKMEIPVSRSAKNDFLRLFNNNF